MNLSTLASLAVAGGITLLTVSLPALPISSVLAGQEVASSAEAGPRAAHPTPSPGGEVAPTAEELRFVELANEERARQGLGPLVVDPLLIRVARGHSAEMRDRDYFGHESPVVDRKTPMDRYLLAARPRPGYACVGENLFYCSVVDVSRGHRALMNSPTHRDNILFPRFEKIGVGIVQNEHGHFWVTQLFLTNTDPVSVARASSRAD